MIQRLLQILMVGVLCTGCAAIEFFDSMVDRPIPPDAYDLPLTGNYLWYDVPVLDRVHFFHKWTMKPCHYMVMEAFPYTESWRKGWFTAQTIVEKDGHTWQRWRDGNLVNIDWRTRSVRVPSSDKDRKGQLVEIGLYPMCFQYWWKSSQYLRLRVFRMSLDEFETFFSDRYPTAVPWTRQTRNGLEWRVKKVPPEQMRPPPLNGIGGPYLVWMTTIADTGYSVAFEMGASTDSLQFPRAQEALEAVFHEIVGSFDVQPLERPAQEFPASQPSDKK